MTRENSINPDVMISSIYNSLTKSEQKVADVVKEHLKECIYWSVSDLAEYAGVGETTVIRFCRKLGYKGYQDFKLAVAQNKEDPPEQEMGEVQATDSLEVLAKKITAQNVEILQNTLHLMQKEQMEQAAKAVLKANNIFIFGVGASGIMAQQANYRLMRLGFPTHYAVDSHIIAMNCALAKEGDVVIGITVSGSTKDVIDAMEIAYTNKAFTICITSHLKSPVTRFSNAILLTATKENPLHGGAFSSLISQLHILDIFTKYIEFQQNEKSIDSLQKTAKAVIDKRY